MVSGLGVTTSSCTGHPKMLMNPKSPITTPRSAVPGIGGKFGTNRRPVGLNSKFYGLNSQFYGSGGVVVSLRIKSESTGPSRTGKLRRWTMTRSALAEEEVPEGWDKWAIAAEQGFNTFATETTVKILETLYAKRLYARFYVLETIARVPYFALAAGGVKIHSAESWNELHHLLVMEALGRDERWFDRFLAQHIAVAYYFLTVLMYLVSPRMAYNFSKCVEKHAFSTYDKFIESHGEELKLLPAPEVAVQYYTKGDIYMFATKCSRNRGPVVGVSSVKFSMSCPPPESERLQLDTSAGRPEALRSRRDTVIGLLLGSTTLCFSQWLDAQEVLAEEEAKQEGIAAVQKQESVFDGLKALLDPNETTKSGKKLPKAYLKSARGVVTKLRDSFSGDSKNETQFRRNADSAKEAIRDYVSNWRGSKEVSSDESYQALEKALRVLGEFYSKQGPRAALPGDVRARVLESLQTADDNL